MPKCQCAGNSCSCNIAVGDGLTITGTGNANSPFTISLNSQITPVNLPTAGPIDISSVRSGGVAYVSLSANATAVVVPTVLGVRYDVIVRHVVANTTITFPASVIWAGGNEPTEATAAGSVDWYTFRYVGDFTIGTILSTNAT